MSDWPLFDEFLRSKKIDSKAFMKAEVALYDELKTTYDQVHPDSFTAQKLFLINPIRRKYPLKEENTTQQTERPKMMRPKIAKPKIN